MNGLGPAAGARARIHVLQVLADRGLGDDEPPCDLRVAESLADEGQDVGLARRQSGRWVLESPDGRVEVWMEQLEDQMVAFVEVPARCSGS